METLHAVRGYSQEFIFSTGILIFFFHSLNLTHFITSSGIVFIRLNKKISLFMKTMEISSCVYDENKLGGFLLHGCVFFPSSPLTSAELVAFSAIDCFKTTDKKTTQPKPYSISCLFQDHQVGILLKTHAGRRGRSRGCWWWGAVQSGEISVAGALGTPSCSVFSCSPRAALLSGAWRAFPGSLWSWAGCGAVLISILQALCVQQVQKRQ